jgi:hypothetical protein
MSSMIFSVLHLTPPILDEDTEYMASVGINVKLSLNVLF